MVGWRVYAVGPWGWETVDTTAVERDVGVERLGYQAAGRGAVFRHVYGPRGRVSEILGRPEGFRVEEVLRAVDEVRPDAVLISPVTGEEAGHAAALLAQRSDVRCVALDVQGYVRGYGGSWPGLLPGARTLLVHMSSDDEGAGEALRWVAGRHLLVYTRGAGPVTIAGPGGLSASLPGPSKIVRDPTGAGDIFTAIALAEWCSGAPVEEAVARALEKTPEALEEARRTLGQPV
jgi:sugar/nucleoside kinase (ribokinase family)